MLRKLSACLCLACICGPLMAVIAPGDSLDQAIDELGEPRARISLPDKVYLLAFDRGVIWVRGTRVVGVDSLTAEAFADRQKASVAQRDQLLRRELETVTRDRARELAADAEAKRQASLVEQVRKEVRFPTYPLSAFGNYYSVDAKDSQSAQVAVDFSRPADHDRGRNGAITKVYLIVTNCQPTEVERRNMVLTFVSRDGEVKAVAQAVLPSMAPNERTTLMVPVPAAKTGGNGGVGDGRSIYELRMDLYDEEMRKVTLTNSRWLRVDPDSPEANFR